MTAIWQWSPNWRMPVTERYEWLSDAMRSKNLTEQVQRLRSLPRQTIEFEAMATARQRRAMETALWAHQADAWLLPVWRDVSHLPSGLPAGSISIPAQTDYRSYQAGGQAVILSGAKAEAVTVASASGGTVTLTDPTTLDHGPGARIYPARLARLTSGDQPITRLTDDLVTLRCRFRYLTGLSHVAASLPTYRGLPVLKQSPNWSGDLGYSYRRQLAVLDYGVAAPYVEDTAGRAEAIQTHRWQLSGREAIDQYLGLIHATQGRQGALWLPTWADDLRLLVDIGATDTSIDIEHCGYTANLLGQINRRDIEIVLRDGTRYRRRITSAAEITADKERLGLDASLGAAVAVSDVLRISWLQVARPEADAVEIVWDTDSLAASAQELRIVNDDL